MLLIPLLACSIFCWSLLRIQIDSKEVSALSLIDLLIRGVVLTRLLMDKLMMKETLAIHVSLDFGLATLGLVGLLYITNLRKRAGFWLGVFGLGATSFVMRSKIAGGLLSPLLKEVLENIPTVADLSVLDISGPRGSCAERPHIKSSPC